MPITGDCIVTTEGSMFGGRTSSGQLVVRLPTQGTAASPLTIGDGNIGPSAGSNTYTFAAGTRIESGALVITASNVWNSNIAILKPSSGVSRLGVAGAVNGRVDNAGEIFVGSGGTVRGHVENEGLLWLDPLGRIEGRTENHGTLFIQAYHIAESATPTQIRGDLRQGSTGSLNVSLPTSAENVNYHYTLRISGRADLSGTLVLRDPNDGWDAWPLPTTPSAAHILHADGGVFGAFDRWTSPGLFVEGNLRYGSHDVWFDLTRVSVAAAMAGNGIGSALTLASAGNLDRLFARADGLALMAPASLSQAQHRLLASAGAVLRIADIDQATRTLDTLSGAMHADALQATLRDGATHPATSQRLAAMQPGFAAGAWAKTDANGSVSGFDQWLSSRLLIGVHASQGSDNRRDTFGQSSRLSPEAGGYLRWFGDNGWYAGGSAAYAQHTLALDRTIDLGRGGQWNAHARHRFNLAGVQGEAGRRVSVGAGTLTPYVALDATVVRSQRAIEQGSTGFELALQPAMQAQLGAGLGLRLGREWRLGDTGWLRLEADARVQRQVAETGNSLQAAFVGMPDLWFDVPRRANRSSGWLDLGLRGGFGRDWTWSFAHARALGAAPAAGPDWRVGLHRSF